MIGAEQPGAERLSCKVRPALAAPALAARCGQQSSGAGLGVMAQMQSLVNVPGGWIEWPVRAQEGL